MKKIILLIFVLLYVISVYGMFNDYEPSARARAMSGAFTSFSDDYSAILYNPAGLKYSGNQLGATYYKLFSHDFSTVMAVSGSYATDFGSFGIGFQQMSVDYFDVNLMNEKTISIGHSFFLNKDIHSEISLGYSANLYTLDYHELGDDMAFGVNAGVIAVLHQRTKFGFMLTNINKPQMGKDNSYEIPQQFAVGLSYIPYQGVITAVDLKKNWEGVTELRTGVEVEVHPIFCLRMGVRNNPASFSFGAGFDVLGIKLDYAGNTHAVLDLTHHFSIGYKF